MSSIADYAENKLLDTIRGISFSVTSTWVKLHLADPGETGTGTAATETTRQQVTWATASGGSMASSNSPSWTSYPTTETVSHISIWDTSVNGAGNCLWKGALSASKSMQTGDTLTLTSLTLTLD